MATKGKNVNTVVPFIPEIERGNMDNPTVFWVHPKNMLKTYQTLNLYQKAQDQGVVNPANRQINPQKMFEADNKDFLETCIKVQNFQFSDQYADLAKQGVIAEITDPGTLRFLVQELDPAIYQEVQVATANWEKLKAGEEAYNNWQAEVKAKGSV